MNLLQKIIPGIALTLATSCSAPKSIPDINYQNNNTSINSIDEMLEVLEDKPEIKRFLQLVGQQDGLVEMMFDEYGNFSKTPLVENYKHFSSRDLMYIEFPLGAFLLNTRELTKQITKQDVIFYSNFIDTLDEHSLYSRMNAKY